METADAFEMTEESTGPRLRIGQGWDRHRLAEDRPLILGGISIPSPLGELGHSDGDVLTHAVIDALLGAARLGDIGSHFPPSDARWKDACSMDLLEIVIERISSEGYMVINIDSTIILEKPALKPHIEKIIQSLASRMSLHEHNISVKAKTAEKTAPVGTSEAIDASAVVLLQKIDNTMYL